MIVISDEENEYQLFLDEEEPEPKTLTNLDVYYKEQVVRDFNTKFNVLDWWKVNECRFKILSRMARDILAIQMIFAASESAFSTGGRVVTDHRSRLLSTTVEAIVCTGDWLRDFNPLDNLEDVSINY